MSTQQALVVTAIGQPLTATTRPIPQPGPKQVQLRVTVAGLNPHDQKARDLGIFIKDNLPAVLGNDVAGVVTALGSDITKFKVGDRVYAQGLMNPDSLQKGLQQFVVVEEAFTAHIPDGFTDSDGASLPTNLLPAIVGLFNESGLNFPAPWTEEAKTFDFAGLQLLIIGGGSNCGRFAVQVAKLAGIGKIVVVGGDEGQLKKFGATHVLDRHGGDHVVLQRIRDVVGDDLLYVFDAVNGAEGQPLGINALSNNKKGKFARLVFLLGPPNASKIHEKNAGYDVKDVFGSSDLYPKLTVPFWERIGEYLVRGDITPLSYDVIDGLDAAKANEVLDRYRDGKPVIQTHFRISL